MNKRLIIIILIILIGLSFVIYKSLFGTGVDSGFDITINNRTNAQIEGLKITYYRIRTDITIPLIKPNTEYKIHVNPNEDFVENSMKIYYTDKFGNKHEETIIGYFEKGYTGKVYVDVVSVDTNRKITFKVTEKLF